MPPDPPRDGANGRLSTSSSPSLSPSPSSVDIAAAPRASGGRENSGGTAPESSASAPSLVKTPSPCAPPRPSLLSRLSLPLQLPLPLRTRNRNVVDFHIRCDEPHKTYAAGDSVRGAVVLVVVKPLRITHLVVSLHGFVRVLKDPTSVAKAQSVTTLPPAGSSRRPQYQGNGLISLFQDEQVLSGEGRVEPGKYEFGFDLKFPDKGLPSSIDFERGTISYSITATLTRPTTIAPTSTCERKITLIQQIDVGLLAPPRSRTIFLEPISKRTRRKRPAVQEKQSGSASVEINDVASEADSSVVTEDSTRADNAHSSPIETRGGSVPSDMHSEISGESGRSVSTASRAEFTQLSHVGSTLTSAAKQQVVDDKTITTTVELLKGGCLPGDTVSVRVTVQHIKRVKSMTGVIATLFRQGRIDTNPPPLLVAQGVHLARRLHKDDPYPKSRTGLGGLSLSSSSSTSVFRKDLDQNAAPLIIDPETLQASVTVSVRVPDDAFPTIRAVPGDMISFKYQVEVIVDLGGRLSSQLGAGGSKSRFGTSSGNNTESNQASFGPQRGSNIADTSQVRRERGIISLSFETVVGTTDSSKARPATKPVAKTRTIRIAEADEDQSIQPETSCHINPQHPLSSILANGQPHLSSPNTRLDYTSPPRHPAHVQQQSRAAAAGSSRDIQVNGHNPLAAPSYIPPPQIPDQTSMTEKDRIRQAETRLLPSQPPAVPSAPGEDDDIYDAEDTPRAPSSGPLVPTADEAEAAPSAPTEDEVTAGQPREDKQELERQRLMEEASAPPEFPDDMERPGGSSSADTAANEATAPDLGDADEYPGYGVGGGSPRDGGGSHAEQLPAYRR
ncbi:pH response protein PalF [Metarhizium album ARSEF 1941]|uniref:pH response protein PalF n=1 Tax=Metarhizium album (strain ARSEF 1941) TaxID=1081103 RepID=A0A0B2X3M2_METAS|nr:pH response protein PalF [Metarhizium album ARSEF 1941]KHN99910.1 pH response protein PalF [Metarhizium album ARSEF 1941]